MLCADYRVRVGGGETTATPMPLGKKGSLMTRKPPEERMGPVQEEWRRMEEITSRLMAPITILCVDA